MDLLITVLSEDCEKTGQDGGRRLREEGEMEHAHSFSYPRSIKRSLPAIVDVTQVARCVTLVAIGVRHGVHR